MKKCPFCAEEIQEEAIYCRYCGKKVTGLILKRILKWGIIIAVVFFLVRYRATVEKTYYDIKYSIKKVAKMLPDVMNSIDNMTQQVKTGVSALESYKDQEGRLNKQLAALEASQYSNNRTR